MKWKVLQLNKIASEDRVIVPPDSPEAVSRPYLGLEQVESGSGRILSYDNNSAEGKSTTFAFGSNHVLYGKLRPYLNKVAVPEINGRCSTEIIPLLPVGVDREFLAFLLRTDKIVSAAMADKTGSRMPRADMDALLNQEVKIPETLPEQRQIAARLKAQLAEVETARQAAQVQLSDARLLRSRLISETFENLNVAPTILGDVIITIQAGKSFQTSEILAQPDELGVLKVSAVSWSSFQPDQAKSLNDYYEPEDHHRVCKDDFIISRANTKELVGAVVLVERDYPFRLLSDKTLRLVIDEEKADKEYLLYALRTPLARNHIEHFATGTSDSMRNISQGVITSIPLVLPSKPEQKDIVHKLKTKLIEIDALEQSSKAALADIEKLPARILAHAFEN
ncbi:restriction endonuclease subunit S [Vibrio cholerae]|uniref:restriction endonuclease subunit S n=1 Tax=Vibrio cholerae TaxID=666 RepID=UPI0030808F3A